MLKRTSSKQETGGNQQEENLFSLLQPCGPSCVPLCAICWQSLTAQAKVGLQSPGPSITKPTIEEGSFQAEAKTGTLSYLLLPSPCLSYFPQAQSYIAFERKSKPANMPLRNFQYLN